MRMCREPVPELGREPLNFDPFVSTVRGGAGWRDGDGPAGNPACESVEEARLCLLPR